jgi:alpha-glucosidase
MLLKRESDCPGYTASSIEQTKVRLTADLTLAGEQCNIHGKDVRDLKFIAEYQTGG